MKIKMKNKTYEYDYKTVLVRENLHKQVKDEARAMNLSMSDYLQLIINQKKCTCPNGEK
jgi:hypothetical protein